MIYFLQQFYFYLEGSEFEILTENQVLKTFINKSNLSRREVRWLDFIDQFGIKELKLIKGKVPVLGDSPLRAPQFTETFVQTNAAIVQELKIDWPKKMTSHHETNHVFKHIFLGLKGNFPTESVQKKRERERVILLLPEFSLEGYLLKYHDKICVPRCNLRNTSEPAHHCKVSGRLSNT